MDKDKKDLFYLNELSDYKVADDYADVRGWDVKDVDGRVVGKVDDFLVSKSAERVVYLDIEVDTSIIEVGHDVYGKSSDGIHEFLNKDGENHLIIPIGMVTISRDRKDVITTEINHETFAKTKRFAKGFLVNTQYEVASYNSYRKQPDGSQIMFDDNFYNRQDFESL
ncbi:PRC-barrel domain-containing protein [Flavobacterium antarcticum]|uniref:PRC-barrel domain-containing protein n=1 Tax=Flavobacterium antarcticum TaxID=271155 RepID=UPI0003B60814|nr:PRC-barrel domain-containing protein [Flavobacterium antarcticum]